MQYQREDHASRLLAALLKQQVTGRQCDVTLRVNGRRGDEVRAHKCILAACSEYFRAMFDSRLAGDTSLVNLTIQKIGRSSVSSSADVLSQVIDYMYTGKVCISEENAEDLVGLADYLGIAPLVEFSSNFLLQGINERTCLRIKLLSDTYSLKCIASSVDDFVMKRWPILIEGEEIRDLPYHVISGLLDPSGRMGFARERDVLKAALRWISRRKEDIISQRASIACDKEIKMNTDRNQPSLDINLQDLTSTSKDTAQETVQEHMIDAMSFSNTDSSYEIGCTLGNDKLLKKDDCMLDADQMKNIYNLLDYVEFRYLPCHVLETMVLNDTGVMEYLSSFRQKELKDIYKRVAQEKSLTSNHLVDIILIRSRRAEPEERVKLLCYAVQDDCWKMLKSDTNLQGLESMIVHMDSVYFLSSKAEDLHGYFHTAKETKVFFRLNLVRDSVPLWEVLSPPLSFEHKARLMSFSRRILAIDGMGTLEEYSPETNTWVSRCSSGCGFTNTVRGNTLYYVPMTIDDKIFLLRAISSGNSPRYAEKYFALYSFQSMSHAWTLLSEVESTELFPTSGLTEVDFHSYAISPGRISLLDDLNQGKVTFDLTTRTWHPVELGLLRPNYFGGVVYGSTNVGGRVYCVTRNSLGCFRGNEFWMYDNVRKRFKLTAQPNICPSGLLCRLTLPKNTLDEITE